MAANIQPPGAPPGAPPTTRRLPQLNTVFPIRNKPPGTPGKDGFCAREALELSSMEYLGFLNTVRDIANAYHFDWTKDWRRRNATIVTRIYNKTVEIYPGLLALERPDIDNPQWPV
ncbi:hypothetical protein FRC06_011072, partial [Ceratobasidium sp. 370]